MMIVVHHDLENNALLCWEWDAYLRSMRLHPLPLLLPAVLPPLLCSARDRVPIAIALDVSVEWRTEVLAARYRANALAEAAAIWTMHGVQLRWRDIDGTIVLIVGDRLAETANRRQTPLGWLTFVDGAPDHVLHVSATAARRIVRDQRFHGRSLNDLPPPLGDQLTARVVGRAIAHEVGHYLLASTAHTSRGLMRAAFRADEAASPVRHGFRLDGDQQARLARSFAAPGQEKGTSIIFPPK
jgi:hypothetical protein